MVVRKSDPPRLPIPRTVSALGLVSMFTDISSEIVHSLLPLFLTATLGVSTAMVGLIDGFAEAAASISMVFSGYDGTAQTSHPELVSGPISPRVRISPF